ncbi:MAG: N-acetyltransferase family protein [Bacteroidia bacterium]|jgi:phosphinothricin acetyltransferase|nr:N-acetyltransferase family protein [Bacteroidia bacterium]
MQRSALFIRKAIKNDVPAIASIYNEAIVNTTATFDTEPKSIDDRVAWLHQHSDRYPVLVALLQNEVVGFASLTRWSDRTAYDYTAEISIYLKPAIHNAGYGKQLMKAIIDAGKQGGLHTILSRITQGNEKSIYLHSLHGFTKVGVLKEVGKKFGQWLDVTIMQLVY